MLQVYGSLWASESFSGLKQGYWIVSWDNEMVLKILIYWIVARLTFPIVFKIFLCFFHFLSLTTNTGQRNFLRLGDGLFDRMSGTKNWFWAFLLRNRNILSFAFFSFFLYDLFTNNGRNLEIAESNPIMKYICSSLSVPSFLFSFTLISLSLYLSLSPSVSLSLSLSLSLCLCRTSAAVMLCNIIIYYPH